MHSRYFWRTILLALLGSVLIGLPALADEDGGQNYRVTITNLTKKQILTPPLLVSHLKSIALFTLAQPANDELAALAEGGNTQPLAALLGTKDKVLDIVIATAPILPGGTLTLDITAKGRFNRLSLAGMLASTNDGFFALNGIILPRHGSRTFTAVAYDAGSEANTETCTDVPGPPCAADSGNARVTVGAEGFVYVHNGIHGISDLNAANMDWHNPVAKVVIEKTK